MILTYHGITFEITQVLTLLCDFIATMNACAVFIKKALKNGLFLLSISH
jgi:hypothetical protein